MSPRPTPEEDFLDFAYSDKVKALSKDFGLARMFAMIRTLRLADGPDEVHRNQIARLELREH